MRSFEVFLVLIALAATARGGAGFVPAPGHVGGGLRSSAPLRAGSSPADSAREKLTSGPAADAFAKWLKGGGKPGAASAATSSRSKAAPAPASEKEEASPKKPSPAPAPAAKAPAAKAQVSHKGAGGMNDTRDPEPMQHEDPRKSISVAPSFEEYMKQRK